MDLREVKLNIWKKWRKEPEEKKKETESKHSTNHVKWLAKIEETLERMKREVEEKMKADATFEEKRKKLLADNKLKQEEILRKNMERKKEY